MSTIEIPPRSEDTRVIVLCIGLQASGKSTWAKEQVRLDPDRWRRVNRDDLRLMLWNGVNGSYQDEVMINDIQESVVWSALAGGKDVIVDNTNLKARNRKAFHLIAENVGNCIVVEKVFPCRVDVAIERNLHRCGPAAVPSSVIIDKAKRFHVGKDGSFKNIKDSITEYKESIADTLIQDENLPPAVICDLDGTLCLIGERNRYDASRCEEDTVNQPVLDVLSKFAGNGDDDEKYEVIFMSGRSEEYRPETIRWLNKNYPYFSFKTTQLFMRAEGDMRKDSIVKKELFEKHVKGKYFVQFVMDDRSSVCRMWRHTLGLTVFQVAEGNF